MDTQIKTMSKCRRCNRTLKTEPYASMGIGKICASKEAADKSSRASGNNDTIVPYDGGDIWIERDLHGGIKTNVRRSETKHSPTGYNYGYGGSGPSDFALNTLLMLTDRETAHNLYQDFKWKYVSGEQSNRLVIRKEDIMQFIQEHKATIEA